MPFELTSGFGTPDQVEAFLRQVKQDGILEKYPHLSIAFHFHDPLAHRGMALANVLAVLGHGHPRMTTFDGSIGGLGGSPFATAGSGQGVTSGNIPTEMLALLFQTLGIKTDLNLNGLIEIARHLQENLTPPGSPPYAMPSPFLYDKSLDPDFGLLERNSLFYEISGSLKEDYQLKDKAL